MLEFIILGTIYSRSLSGYDIKNEITNGVGIFYKASFGSIYPILKKLNSKNLISMNEESSGKRIKKIYSITKEGKEIFLEWLTSPMNLEEGTNHKLAKIYFFDKLDKKDRDIQLDIFEKNNIEYLRFLYELRDKYESMDNKDCFYYKLSTLYYGICITKENIRFFKHIKEMNNLSDLL